jgi:transketolase
MRSQRETWGATLAELGAADPDILVLDGDLANSTKADIFAQRHPDRFLQMGIAEQNLVGVAVGLATMGYVPWLSSFAVFLTHRSLDQIRLLVAQPGANVKIGAAYAGLLTGLTGKTHQDVQDLAIMRAMPGMTVLAPGDEVECAAMTRWATEHEGPVYLRLTRDPTPVVFDPTYRFEPGGVHQLRDGRDVLLISTGPQTGRCLEAAAVLETAGVSVGVLHVPTIKPVDAAAVVRAARRSRLLVTVEEHTVIGGLGGLVAEIVTTHASKRLVRIGLEDCWGESAPNDFLLEKHGLSGARVADRVMHELRERKPARAASPARQQR